MRIRLLCAVIASALCFSAVNCFASSSNVYRCAMTKEKKIALTFDDGPHYKYTDKILDILEKYGVKATFFVIGENAERHPEKVKRIASLGHEIGNHTYSHPHLKKVSGTELGEEIQKASDVICKLTGKKPVLFRPPEGYCGADIAETAKKHAARDGGYPRWLGCWLLSWRRTPFGHIRVSFRGEYRQWRPEYPDGWRRSGRRPSQTFARDGGISETPP